MLEQTQPHSQTSLGNYHASIICPESEEDEALKIISHIQRRAVQLEGTITGEHGIGLELRDMLVEEVGDSAVRMMRAVSDTRPRPWSMNITATDRTMFRSSLR